MGNCSVINRISGTWNWSTLWTDEDMSCTFWFNIKITSEFPWRTIKFPWRNGIAGRHITHQEISFIAIYWRIDHGFLVLQRQRKEKALHLNDDTINQWPKSSMQDGGPHTFVYYPSRQTSEEMRSPSISFPSVSTITDKLLGCQNCFCFWVGLGLWSTDLYLISVTFVGSTDRFWNLFTNKSLQEEAIQIQEVSKQSLIHQGREQFWQNFNSGIYNTK